jgi:peptide/nickel transport system substrate-binding protein
MVFSRVQSLDWRLAFCAIAAIDLVSVAACRPSSQPSAQALTLRIGVQRTVEAPRVITNILYTDPLFAIDWHGRPALRLASDFTWQDEARTLQVSIRPGVQFHDGTPVTAEAVAEVLRQQERTGGFQFVTTVETPHEGVVLIHLSRPDAFLLDAVSGTPIVRVDQPDIGTGPFKLVSRDPAIRAERNGAYFRGAPGIRQVQVTSYDTPRMAWVAMMRGEVDMVTDVNRESVEFLRGAKRFDTYPFLRPFYIPLVFNVRNRILRNVEVRRALADAVDRDEIVRSAMRGHGQVAEDPLWPLNWAYTPAARHHSFDPGAAAARLDAAGFPISTVGADTMPSRFRIRCLFWNKDPQYERIALMLQRQFAAIGVDLELDPREQRLVEEGITAGDFDTYIYQLASGKSFDYTYRFWHADSNGVGAMQNTGYTGVNDVLDRLRASHADAEVRVAVADLRQRFYEDTPAAFIAWVEATRAVNSRFDVGDSTDPDMLANLWRWSVATPQQRAAR